MTKVAQVDIELSKEWKIIVERLNPAKIGRRVEIQIGKATRVNGMMARRQIRGTIRKGVPPPNAPLTKFIKGSSKAVVDNGELWKAITSVVIDPWTAEVGVLKGDPNANTAYIVHEGANIPVTPAMRGMFGLLAAVSRGDQDVSVLSGRALELWNRNPGAGWKDLSPNTTHIKIKGRPYIRLALEDPDLRMAMAKNWMLALEAGINGTGAKLSSVPSKLNK